MIGLYNDRKKYGFWFDFVFDPYSLSGSQKTDL